MRVDLANIPGQGGLKVKTGTNAFAASLKEGDNIKAQVLSAGKDAVIMKTADGQTFRARLDPEVILSLGDSIMLEVTGKEEEILSLSIRDGEKEGEKGEKAENPELVRDFEDKTLLPYASKLSELKMPVTEEAARLMKELIAENPGMTLDEAAFIASNKLDGDENLVKAAMAILTGGEKTDVMLERLLALLLQHFGDDAPGVAQTRNLPDPVSGNTDLEVPNPEAGNSAPEVPNPVSGNTDTEVPNPIAGNTGFEAPSPAAQIKYDGSVTEWITLIESGESDSAGAILRGEQTPLTATQEIIPQSDSNMQSRILENNVEMMKNDIFPAETPVTEPQNPVNAADGAQPGIQNPEPEIEGTRAAGTPPPKSETANQVITGSNEEREISAANSTDRTPNPQITGEAITGLLSELQEFRGTPAPALERFSNMLMRIAGENADATSGDLEKLTNLLDKMFTRIEKSDKDAGARLKSAKEELFTRLAFLEETIARAEPPAKTQMLEQTRRLIDHVRLLNNIDQFVYLQLPVQIGEERKTAELYLFKKKGGKKLDPENVNILLALDLENMGHWEGLINFRNKDVSVRMEVAGPAQKDYFSEKTVLLHNLLDEAGFRLVSTDIKHTEQETTPLTALSVFDKLTSPRPGAINFTI